MSFLQPWLLAALPLAALPIIIHLINQRRYQTVQWAAMMFLLAANRMSRGYARIRQWLILAFRVLAIGALVFAISRPLAGGWLGLAAGSRPDTTLILLDRSPSMRQTGDGGGASKLETARRQLVQTLETIGSTHWVLIESGSNQPKELESLQSIATLPSTDATSATSDLPAMLQAARDYLQANKSGRTEVWICSDLRANDWNAESGRWQSVRDGLLEVSQATRIHLLAYPRTAPGNLGIRVKGVRRQIIGEVAELLVSLQLTREGGGDGKENIPLHFEIDGARSETTVEMNGPKLELKDYRIPLDRNHLKGWGRVSIPADANPSDNDDWFVFDEPVTRRAVIVADDAQVVRPLQLASAIPPDPLVKCESEVVATENLGTVEWENLSLLLWRAPLPNAEQGKLIKAFIDRGGQAIFFPPASPDQAEFLGVRWTGWSDHPDGVQVENWRSDQDLLSQTLSGGPLPVGQLTVRRSCGLSGEFTPLATLRGGDPLLARVSAGSGGGAGGAYFCGTSPAGGDSSLASNGIVLYVLIQRAMAQGAKVLGNTRELIAGDPAGEDPSQWKKIAGSESALSTDYALHEGIYSSGEKLLAVVRSPDEDLAPVVADDRVAGLFRGLDFSRVDDQAGNVSSLIQEIWRTFLLAMMVAMVVEAGLCLPRPRPATGAQ